MKCIGENQVIHFPIENTGQNVFEDNSDQADMTEDYGHLYNQSVAKKSLSSSVCVIQFYISLI